MPLLAVAVAVVAQELCEQWTNRITEEFYEEGDAEKELGLDIGALNDRETVVVPKAQVPPVPIPLPVHQSSSRCPLAMLIICPG